SRALAFVVDCSTCKEFFLAAEGSGLRPMAMQFTGAEAVMDGSAPVLWSNMNAVWQGAPSYWWEGNADLDSLVGGLALNRLQRVTLAPNAAFAVIGVRGGNANALLKSLRLFAPATEAPQVLAGAGRAWGTRELTASLAYDPPSIAAGASAAQAVTLPYVQNGDFVQASFSGQGSAYIDWSAAVTTTGGAGTVTARASNRHGTLAIDLAAGTLFLRAVKPRL
ncbi:MAG: phage tail fiber protein, partial [Paracraurococcus sp.]